MRVVAADSQDNQGRGPAPSAHGRRTGRNILEATSEERMFSAPEPKGNSRDVTPEKCSRLEYDSETRSGTGGGGGGGGRVRGGHHFLPAPRAVKPSHENRHLHKPPSNGLATTKCVKGKLMYTAESIENTGHASSPGFRRKSNPKAFLLLSYCYPRTVCKSTQIWYRRPSSAAGTLYDVRTSEFCPMQRHTTPHHIDSPTQ